MLGFKKRLSAITNASIGFTHVFFSFGGMSWFPLAARSELDWKVETTGARGFGGVGSRRPEDLGTHFNVALHTFLRSKMHEPSLLRLLSILISVPAVTSTGWSRAKARRAAEGRRSCEGHGWLAARGHFQDDLSKKNKKKNTLFFQMLKMETWNFLLGKKKILKVYTPSSLDSHSRTGCLFFFVWWQRAEIFLKRSFRVKF